MVAGEGFLEQVIFPHQEGRTTGTEVEEGARLAFSSQHHDVASPKLALPSSLLPPVRLMAPDSFHVVHVETHRCNISWSVSQCSHYIEKYLEFEARMRSPGHSWEVSPWARPDLP